MLIQTRDILQNAQQNQYAVGGFNIYNLEGALAVIQAAAELNSPVILQILPSALALGGTPLVHLCIEAGKKARIPVAVHLDHCSSIKQIQLVLDAGISSVMADGSMLSYEGNLAFTKDMVQLSAKFNAGVEAELGRIGGSEDGLPETDLKARMTEPCQAIDFVEKTGIAALAVCIGNIHGKYTQPPNLDFERLSEIEKCTGIPLVLHGTSGLPDETIEKAICLGVCKFNVNTEIRSAYLNSLSKLFRKEKNPELVDVMKYCMDAMTKPIKEKIRLFGSADQAFQYKKSV